MTKALLRSCAALALATLPISASAGGIEYTITDLGNNIYPNAINSEGHVTGADGNTSQAFIYNGTTVGDIGVSDSVGYAINSSNEVAGSAFNPNTGTADQPFIYSSVSGISYLGGPGGDPEGSSTGINSNGEVVGNRAAYGPFLYDGSSIINLYSTSLGDYAQLNGINDSGQITGQTNFSGSFDAFIYNQDGTIQNLGTLLGGGSSEGLAINDSNDVVGTSATASGNGHAFLYTSTDGMIDLGTLGGPDSAALGIDNSGAVVGWSENAGGGTELAFIYSNGVMTDLNSLIDPALGLTLGQANGINGSGQIIAEAYNASGQEEGVLLRPVVPVPAALPAGMALLGLVAVVRRRRLAI